MQAPASARRAGRMPPRSRPTRERNDIQESLEDLGPDTPYTSGQPIDPAIEAASQPNCTPLNEWRFTLRWGGRGTRRRG